MVEEGSGVLHIYNIYMRLLWRQAHDFQASIRRYSKLILAVHAASQHFASVGSNSQTPGLCR